jgi:hypothetical protein
LAFGTTDVLMILPVQAIPARYLDYFSTVPIPCAA